MKKLFFTLSIVIFSLLFIACNDSATTSDATPVTDTTSVLAVKPVSQLSVTDVNGQPLGDAQIEITPVSTVTNAPSLAPSFAPIYTLTTDSNGLIVLDDLGEGLYTLSITIQDLTFSITLEISSENLQALASVMTPVSVSDEGIVSEISGAVIASVSGSVMNNQGNGIANAQVSISGGSATNGTFASAITNTDGGYKLLINISDTYASEINASKIIISATGYTTAIIEPYQVVDGANKAGVNFTLTEEITSESAVLYSENFESGTNGWSVSQLSGLDENNTWHIHTSDTTGINTAYANGLVKLAPNDTSAGAIPAPIGTKCFWYGNGEKFDSAFGSFLDILTSVNDSLDGGIGSTDNSGELISPAIDLTNVTGNIYVTFDTFWEIESVDPNVDGFDIMTVSVSYDDGVTWRDLARLNPFSDPVSDLDVSPIPFSNTGFNSAPTWLKQEGISLVDINGNSLAGQTIKLKFTFATIDNLYNGFRGWMVDNIVIKEGVGTFPLIEESTSSVYNAPSLKHNR
jgi:hypothetical protein